MALMQTREVYPLIGHPITFTYWTTKDVQKLIAEVERRTREDIAQKLVAKLKVMVVEAM